MATRDFKIRTGLVVTGNTEIQGSITVGGNTYSKLLDSDNITNIINNTVTGLADSDLKAIADLRNDVDSDSIAIQALDSTLNTLSTKVDAIEAGLDSETARIQLLLLSTDSDALSIAGIKQEADSDAATIAELLRQADSDAAAIQALNTTLTSDIAAINTRLDSDETQLQAIQTDLETAESNITTIQSDISTINAKLDSDEARLESIDARIDLLEAAPGISDSDLKVMADLRNDVDSDSIKLQALQTEVAGLGGSQSISVTAYTFTSPANDSDFTGTDDNGRTLGYVAGRIHVYLNGILLTNTADYIATDGSTVSLINAPDSDDILTVIKYLGTVQAGFDSEQVVAIINENTSPDIVARLDSDEAQIQALGTSISALDTALTARLDSDEIKIQALGTSISALDTALTARLDSDEIKIQAIQTQLDALDTGDIAALRADADSDSIAIQAIRTSVDSDYSLFNTKIALFNGLTDSDLTTVSNLRNDVDSDSIAIQAVRNDMDVSFSIVNNGASAYTFTGDGFPSGVDNPTLYLERGHTYNFRVNASGHPFEIRQASGGAAYSTGVTNNAAQVGLVTFVVPMDAPDTLAYQCTVHSGMVGIIKVGKAGFDSDQIVGIINENVVTDPTINTRLDSDEIKIQALGTSIESLNTTLTGLSGSAAIQTVVYTFTATQGQTAFTGTDDNGLTLSYAPGYIYVFVNGVLVLDTTDYTATDGSTVNIVEALDSDNTVQIIKHVGTVQAGFDSDQVVAIIGENPSSVPLSSTNLNGTGETQQVFDSFATGDYRSVKYFVSASSNDSSWFATEIIVIHDGTNAYLTEYGTISTHDSEFITFDADVNGGNVRLLGTPSNSLTNVKTVRQHISQS